MIFLPSVAGSTPALEKVTGVLFHSFPHSLQLMEKRNKSGVERSVKNSFLI